MTNILIIGGARSGKSDFAQKLALKSNRPVLFVATAEAQDEEMKRRIEEHRRVRPTVWNTLEATAHLGSQILKNIGRADVVVVDCITLLVSNILGGNYDQGSEPIDASVVEQQVKDEISELIDCMKQVDASFIVVSNEVGMGVVPISAAGRSYRDLLGRANQMLAACCDEVYLMVAGLPVRIKPTQA